MAHAIDTRGPAGRRADHGGLLATQGAALGPRRFGLREAARDYIWLHDWRHGVLIREIAARDGVSWRSVYDGLARARALEASAAAAPDTPDAAAAVREPHRPVPLFPIGPFTPQSGCPHRGPIDPDSPLVCMVCHNN